MHSGYSINQEKNNAKHTEYVQYTTMDILLNKKAIFFTDFPCAVPCFCIQCNF